MGGIRNTAEKLYSHPNIPSNLQLPSAETHTEPYTINLRCLREDNPSPSSCQGRTLYAYMTVLPGAVYSRIFPTSRGSTIRGYWQANSVPLSIDLPDFSVTRPYRHPSDAFYYSVDVTPVAAANTWLPSLSSLSERHCRGRYGAMSP